MRVLVTRPVPQAGRTAAALRSLGHDPEVLPLTKVAPLPLDPRPEWFGADLVALTSANALAGLSPEFLEPFLDKRCFAVGAATVAAANAAGFGDVTEGPGDAAGLAELIAGDARTAAILYLCGRVRRPDLEAALRRLGRTVHAAETYDTVALDLPRSETDRVFARPFQAALLHSALAGETLMTLTARPAVAAALADTRLLCLSDRIAAVLPEQLRRNARVAAAPNEEALLALLSGR